MSKEKPPIVETYREFDHLVIVADFPERDPQSLFKFWIEPSLISKWWGAQIVHIEPNLGGKYELGWPGQNWILRGKYTQFEPDKLLEFTWRWDHEPSEPLRKVRVIFEGTESGGTHLTLTHGDYTRGDAEQRESHLEGWIHFLSKMQAL
jgi:uncharacterized protein YndB with AHSA1/START domain